MKKLAVFFVLLAGTLWGCIGIFVRRYNEIGLSSMQTVAVARRQYIKSGMTMPPFFRGMQCLYWLISLWLNVRLNA